MKQENEIGRAFGLGSLSFVIGVCLRIAATLLVSQLSFNAVLSGGNAPLRWADTLAILSPWFLGLGVALMVFSSSFAMLGSIRKS